MSFNSTITPEVISPLQLQTLRPSGGWVGTAALALVISGDLLTVGFAMVDQKTHWVGHGGPSCPLPCPRVCLPIPASAFAQLSLCLLNL